MRSRRLAIEALFLGMCISAGCLIQPHRTDCPRDASCGSCIAHSGCGYCLAGGGSCTPGSLLGSDDPLVCSDTYWRFTSCESLNTACLEATSCEECLEKGCEYCDLNGGSCDLPGNCSWLYSFVEGKTCPQPNTCYLHESCDDCLLEDGCGFCDTADFCTAAGPDGDLSETCPSGFYRLERCL